MVTSEQRRRQLAREKYERQQANRVEARSKAKRRNAIIAGAVAVVVVAGASLAASGVFSSDGKKKAATASAAPVGKGCTTPQPGSPNNKQWSTEPSMTVDAKATYTATLDTSCGTVTFTMDASKAPHTVNSFVFLAGQNYFDHTKCHRLTTQGIYVLQCGDPTATGSGSPGYKFTDENLTGATYPAGTVAMANSGPNTNGSQFFLVYKDTQLPASYTPFGKITGGMDVLNNIAQAGENDANGQGDGAPNATVVFNKVTAVKD
ncbi:peptidylprolyl isomerase [Kitasatospora viridis]|uniref:Peptidyl-prolyl cis-trans isomerase n=1 Tax=Kitasatospora viridis TaxID=281105 RepID=A0A561UAI8_9ACTN|nr:peptidylprolyl isomerase [Kitasatospora viridis]TWF96380.1 peptidyl-prolyl cis-trans isomerase B (cyclophilin B) [Kitasatospora viridis]